MASAATRHLLFVAGGEALSRYGTIWGPKTSPVERVTPTFTRATTATYRGRDQLLRKAASGIVRAHAEFDSAGNFIGYGLLLEGQRTNLVPDPENFGNWGVENTPVLTSGQADPAGGTAAYRVEDDDGAVAERLKQAVTFTGDGSKAVAIWLKRFDRDIVEVAIRDNTAAILRHLVRVDFSTTPPTLSTQSGAGALFTPEAWSGGWWRILFTVDSVVAANANDFRICPATNNTASETGGVYVFGAQAEDALFPSSYMPPGATTRNADSLTFPLSFGVGDLTAYVRYPRPAHYAVIASGSQRKMELSKDAVPLLQWGVLSSDPSVLSCQIVENVTNPSANRTTPPASTIEMCSQFRDLKTAGQCRLDVGDGNGFSSWSGSASPFSKFGGVLIDPNADFEFSQHHGWHGSFYVLKIASGLHSPADMAAA